MWWPQKFFVKAWLPWVVSDEPGTKVYLWYKSKCRSFCYVAPGKEVAAGKWRWPCRHTGDPARRIIVARIVREGHSTEVTDIMQAFQGPSYDFHGLKREARFWLPTMSDNHRDYLYIVTSGGLTLRFRDHDIISL